MEIFIFWLIFCIVAGVIANNKGRSFFGFFFLAFILSPIIGVVVALIVKPDSKKLDREKIEKGECKKCPYCAEIIKAEASVCRYCGKEVPDAVVNE